MGEDGRVVGKINGEHKDQALLARGAQYTAARRVAVLGGIFTTGELLQTGALTDIVQAQTLQEYATSVGYSMEAGYDIVANVGYGLKPLADAFGHIKVSLTGLAQIAWRRVPFFE